MCHSVFTPPSVAAVYNACYFTITLSPDNLTEALAECNVQSVTSPCMNYSPNYITWTTENQDFRIYFSLNA